MQPEDYFAIIRDYIPESKHDLVLSTLRACYAQGKLDGIKDSNKGYAPALACVKVNFSESEGLNENL